MRLLDAPGGDRGIAGAQARHHGLLLAAGGQPQDAPRTVQQRVGQRHAAVSLVRRGQRDIGVDDMKHRIARHQRCRVAIGAEAQVHQVDERGRCGHAIQRRGITLRGSIEVVGFDRHRMQVLRGQRCMCEQALADVREVARGITGRRDPFVDLEQVRVRPGHVFLRQFAQHLPRRAPAADGEREAAARLHRGACFAGNEGRCPAGHRSLVGQRLDLHRHAPSSSRGLCQPPGGARLSASSGPQLPGA